MRFSSLMAFSLLACLPALSAGCGGFPLPPESPGDEGFRAAGDITPPGVDEDPALPASLAPGDVVRLRMQSTTVEEVAGLVVDERGMLHVPLGGDVDVAGVSLTIAEQRVEQAIREFNATARVALIVTNAAGHQATVIGAVGNQGRVPLVPGMRVADLLAAAGGISSPDAGAVSSLADLAAARLMRDGAAVPVSIALAVTGDPRHNVRVRPGDHLFVPPQLDSLVSIIGEVNSSRVLAHRPGLRLSQALAMAGGYTRDANGGDILIVRGPRNNPTVYRAGIDHIAAGHYADPVLAPGDIVMVGSSALADMRDFMAAIAPIISVAATSGVGVAAVVGRP